MLGYDTREDVSIRECLAMAGLGRMAVKGADKTHMRFSCVVSLSRRFHALVVLECTGGTGRRPL